MRDDSSNGQASWLGPGFPIYPQITQLVRLTGASVLLGGITFWPGFTRQYTPPGGFRDREACYAVEANGRTPAAGTYEARLVGSAGNSPDSRPLYAVTCC